MAHELDNLWPPLSAVGEKYYHAFDSLLMRAAVLLNYCCLPPSRAAIISKLSEASAAARLIYRRISIMTFAVFVVVPNEFLHSRRSRLGF